MLFIIITPKIESLIIFLRYIEFSHLLQEKIFISLKFINIVFKKNKNYILKLLIKT